MKPKKYPTLKPRTKESREINRLQSNLRITEILKDEYERKYEASQRELKRAETELLIEREINKCLRNLIINNL